MKMKRAHLEFLRRRRRRRSSEDRWPSGNHNIQIVVVKYERKALFTRG
jgi:hypothetical protein